MCRVCLGCLLVLVFERLSTVCLACGFVLLMPSFFALVCVGGVLLSQVPRSSSSLNTGDVFILDAGLQLYLWNGPEANMYEKSKGALAMQRIKVGFFLKISMPLVCMACIGLVFNLVWCCGIA